jgi:hypothetical protein
MSEAEQILHSILERPRLTGLDVAGGRFLIELAVDRDTLERLMTFRADQAKTPGDGGSVAPTRYRPRRRVHFKAAA